MTTLRVKSPAEFRHWCRSCRRVDWHDVRHGSVYCRECGRRVLGAELATTYAIDAGRKGQGAVLLLPLHALTGVDYARRFGLGHKAIEGKD